MEKCSKMLVALILLIGCVQIIESLEPLTMSAIVGGASLLTGGAVYQFWDDTIKVIFLQDFSYSTLIFITHVLVHF